MSLGRLLGALALEAGKALISAAADRLMAPPKVAPRHHPVPDGHGGVCCFYCQLPERHFGVPCTGADHGSD